MPVVHAVRPFRLLLSPGDLGHVGAGQDDGDQLNQGQDDPDYGVTDHHRDDVSFKLVLEKSQAAVDEDPVRDLVLALLEDPVAASDALNVTAGVRDGEVCSDGS